MYTAKIYKEEFVIFPFIKGSLIYHILLSGFLKAMMVGWETLQVLKGDFWVKIFQIVTQGME